MKNKLLSFFAIVFLTISFAKAQNTGFMNPTDTALPHGWTNPLNGMVSDAQWATVAHQAGCICPWLYLSWNKGVSYTSYKLMGPFGYSDSWQAAGSPTDNWGHTWIDSELNNSNFRVKIQNPSMSIEQGYRNFNFSIPLGSTINGIELQLQYHGDSAFTTDYLNAMQVNVYYTAPNGVNSVTASTNNIEVYPNPAHGQLTLNVTGLSRINYTLMSVDGRIMEEQNIETTAGVSTKLISVEHYTPGIYLLKVSSNEGTYYRKIIIE